MARASAHPNFAPKVHPAFGDFFVKQPKGKKALLPEFFRQHRFLSFSFDDLRLSDGPFAPVFARRHVEGALEDVLEVVGVVVADLRGNLRDGHICVDEKVLGFAEAAQDDVFHRGKPDFGLEQVGEIVGIGMCGLGDVVEADILLVVFVNEGTGLGDERRCLLFFGDAFFTQEGCKLSQQGHGQVIGDLGVILGFLLDGFKKMQYLCEMTACGLDWGQASGQQMVGRHIVNAQAADCDTVGAKTAARTAEFIVDGMAVVKNQVAFLCCVAPAVDHVDASALVDKDDFAEMVVLMHAARHVRGIFSDVADILETWRGALAERGAIAMIRKILKQ